MAKELLSGLSLLLNVLRQNPTCDAMEDEWALAFHLAEFHQVLPLFINNLPQEPLPVSVQQLRASMQREITHAVFFLTSQLKVLLKILSQADIAVMPLKGPFFAERIYGNRVLRVSKDIDLVVPSKDQERAALVMKQAGVRQINSFEKYSTHWSINSVLIELHHALADDQEFSVDMEEIWTNAIEAEFLDESVLCMAPADELMYLCLHGTRHAFDRFSYCIDIWKAIKKINEVSSEVLLESKGDIETCVYLGFLMAQKYRPIQFPLLSKPLCERQRKRIEKLADELWDKLICQPPKARTGIAWHRFYVRLEPNWWKRQARRVHHAWFLWSNLIPADFTFAAKFGVKLHLPVLLLKPLRIFVDSLQRFVTAAE